MAGTVVFNIFAYVCVCKGAISFSVNTFSSEKVETKITKQMNKKKSLTLLNKKALKAALTVPIRVDQKLIKKKEVIPTSSHPRYNTAKFKAKTIITMLITKRLINKINLLTFGSYLKYAKVYMLIKNAMVRTNTTKAMLRLSRYSSKLTTSESLIWNHLPKFITWVRLSSQIKYAAARLAIQKKNKDTIITIKTP
jgi:hypothetical protein